ncbi:hypothetical protein HanXRQr2_Chr08g0335631 [Helianthus annuus]|uniref:Uncharacterized protein n=1 Tax=Helianthus annuus TaxID=4232 RepID=A0A9K3IDZ3_HELAN|nr:hypothetical protein HanXRQr2_Chr08g0335631 [Helianthus annuus]KAJ0901347.1 hypothetical protein HanPSC8_Chr08g0324271 [Helianthus annuus]
MHTRLISKVSFPSTITTCNSDGTQKENNRKQFTINENGNLNTQNIMMFFSVSKEKRLSRPQMRTYLIMNFFSLEHP